MSANERFRPPPFTFHGFITDACGALRVVCTQPGGKRVVEHTLLTLHDDKVARWSGVQAWDE